MGFPPAFPPCTRPPGSRLLSHDSSARNPRALPRNRLYSIKEIPMGQSVVSNRKARKIHFDADLLQSSIFPTACGWMALLGRERTVHQLKLGYPDEATLLSQLPNP